MPLFPQITVQLSGTDGNAFAVLGKVRREMKRAGVDPEIIKKMTQEATSANYDHLLATVAKYVSIS